jgi:intracellular sulfur oxidation DsrE/DsrF family protein
MRPPIVWLPTIMMAVLVCAGFVGAESSGPAPAHRVVIHVNSADVSVQRGALNNISNLYQELGADQLTVEVVAHGAGLQLLLKDKTALAQELRALKTQYGVHFTACSNTMKAMRLTRGDLVEEVGDTVPAIVRLMERQEQGWSYIKP